MEEELLNPDNQDENFIPENREQYIFSLEFFISKITSERLKRLNDMFFVPTTVELNFLNETVEISPVDTMFNPLAGIPGDSESFYSGKSVLFAIPQHIVADKTTEFKIAINIRKKMPEEIRPDIFVGTGQLDLTQLFAGLRKEMLQCWKRDDPPPKVYEGSVDFQFENKPAGTLEVVARITAFGQCIVTEIRTPSSNNSSETYIFRGDRDNGNNISYKCRIISPSKIDICRESSDDLSKNLPCNICTNKITNCYPCDEENGAQVKRNSRTMSKKNNLNFDNDGFGRFDDGKIIQTSRGAPTPCGKGIVLKVSGLIDTDGSRKPVVTVDSRLSEPDPDYDIFLLRIGKKGLVGPDEKSDLQLEMKTPKGPERRPPIRYETRDMQTDEEIQNVVEKKGKGKPSKKKKKK